MRLKAIVVMPEGIDKVNVLNWLNYDKGFELIGTGTDSNEALALSDANPVIHVAFIYIRLLTGDGFHIAGFMKRAHKNIMCVMFSPSSDDAVLSFNHESFDFMLTPLVSTRFDICLTNVKRAALTRFTDSDSLSKNIILKLKGGYRMIPVKQILYFEYLDRKCYIHQAGQEKIEFNGYTIEQIEETFKSFDFFRCYQSFVVQVSLIEEVVADTINKVYYLTMQNSKTKIPVSRMKYNELMQLLYGHAAIIMKT